MPVKTTVTELPDSRVRLDAEVPSEEVEQRVQRAATALGRELRIPGFRKGKVPGPMVIQRIGREAVFEQAVRDSMPEWYEEAILRSGVSTVGDPKLELDLDDVPAAGAPLSFSIEVSVTPKAELGKYQGLEVGKRSPDVPAEVIDQEVDRLRDAFARVESVDRSLEEGDVAVVDFIGRVDGEPFEGGEARDYMLELGSGRLVEGFEEQLVGASAGDTRTVRIDFPADYRNEDLAGKAAEFEVAVKDVKSKELPDLNDEWVSDASEFDTLAELRASIESTLREQLDAEIDAAFRISAVDELVKASEVKPAVPLVRSRAADLLTGFARSLERRGVSLETYLAASGGSAEELERQMVLEAAVSVARELALEALAERAGIEVSDDDVKAYIREEAEASGEADAEGVIDDVWAHGQQESIREDLRLRAALDRLVADVKPIAPELASARDKLWTPDKEKAEGDTKLWTPGSKETA
jgi:trigger factor